MTLRAKCKVCEWKVRAEGSVYLHLAYEHTHTELTGHKVKEKK